jgi:hypothetical protein
MAGDLGVAPGDHELVRLDPQLDSETDEPTGPAVAGRAVADGPEVMDLPVTCSTAAPRPDRSRRRRPTGCLRELLGLGLTTCSEVGLSPRALALAQELRLPSLNDAVYLALAEVEQAEFWTFDVRLYRAASKAPPWVRLASVPDAAPGP